MFSTEQNVECDLEKGHIHVHNANSCTVNQHATVAVSVSRMKNPCRASIDSLKEIPTGGPTKHLTTTSEEVYGETDEELSRSSIEATLPGAGTTTEEVFSEVDAKLSRSSIEATLPATGGHLSSDGNIRCQLQNQGAHIRPLARASTSIAFDSKFPFEHHKNNLVRVIERRNRWTPPVQFKLKRQQTRENLNDKSRNWARKSENKDFRISLAELHRMHLRKLQCKLVSHVGYMRKFNKEPENWESDLEKYIKAVQDYDYMTTCCNLPRDPFLVTGERQIDSFVIHSILGDVPEDKSEDILPVDGPWEDEPHPIGGTRNYSVVKGLEAQLKDRIMIAAIAGFFLIAPMWLMVLHNTLYTSLVSATAFVTVFGLVLAWFLDTRKEVMSGTAAYAAVLVVFVGVGHT